MSKELINDKEGFCLILIFILGSTMIIGIGGEAKNDAWIAGILAVIISIPIIFVYGRILSLFPGKDLYEILEAVFGKIIGTLVSLLYIWYALHLGALVMRNFGEFVNTATMAETPMLVPLIFLGIVCIVAAKSGVEVTARVCAFVLPFFLFVIIIVQFLGIKALNLHFLRPFFGNGVTPVLKGAFAAFSFPFAETVLFMVIFSALSNKKSYYKLYLWGLLAGGLLIIITTIRNIAILGGLLGKLYFPSHVAVSRIRIGQYIERVEVTVSLVFVIGVFVKASLCLIAACKGISKVFKLQDYRTIVIQTGLLMVAFSHILYSNIMEMQYFAFKVYDYYAFPFQVIIPIILLITAEIKIRKKKIICQ